MAVEQRIESFATCPPGIEPFLQQELFDLGLLEKNSQFADVTGQGGVTFHSTLKGLYRANLWLHTATRVLVRLGRFQALHFTELRRKAAALPWDQYLVPGRPVSVRTTCHHSKLYHSGAVSERILAAVADHFGQTFISTPYEDEQPAGQLILVRLDNDECTISLDTSGEPLHRRGYRQALAKAPLRETLAAAILLASGWDRQSPLLDPFCGSGTIPIEAVLLAANIPPGVHRDYAFMNFPGFRKNEWDTLRDKANSKIRQPAAPIQGSDRDAGAIQAAVDNAARAGVSQWIDFRQASVSDIQPPASEIGWVVTNPPYGLRISSGKDLRALYTQFGNVLRQHCPGWYAAYLCNDERLATLTRFEFGKGLSLNNGGIPVKLSRGRVQSDPG